MSDPTPPDDSANLKNLRALVQFVKALTTTQRLEDLMSLLRREVRIFPKLKEPVLAFANTPAELQLLYFQGASVLAKAVPGVWSQQSKVRTNDAKDRQFLANLFGRPFAKLLTVPLELRRKISSNAIKVPAVVFFEHDMNAKEIGLFFEFITSRIRSIEIALDRLLLERDLNEASLFWERTFDGLQDPVAIFDSENQILRANKSFAENLIDVRPEDLSRPTLHHRGRFFEVHSYPISLDKDSRPTNIINHYVDVTSAHRLQNQMIQNEKMAALGHLAGHIAHELNNPLTGIRSLAQVLATQTREGTSVHSDLREVEHAAERCQLIIKNLLEFSKGNSESIKTVISMNEIVQRTLPLLKTLISRLEVEINLTDKNCEVCVQPNLMQQVVFNIIKNAAQAMGKSGQLSIKTYIVAKPQKTVCLSIRDTGGGVAPDLEKQIFDFFFTTKSQGQGTGIGLSMSKNILDRFGGDIQLINTHGVGSEFVIQLPWSRSKS